MKKRYQKPKIHIKKIDIKFLSFGNKRINFKDGINSFNTLDDLLLASNCCGTCCGGGCTCVSDKRLKKEIKPVKGVIDRLQKLQCISFKWKKTKTDKRYNSKQNIGLIAQDVEKVFPDLVVPHNGVKTIDYAGIMALLVEAVKELKKENMELKLLISNTHSAGALSSNSIS